MTNRVFQMSKPKEFTITLEQLNQMAAGINALATQIGTIAAAPLLAQLNGLTTRPVEAEPAKKTLHKV